MIKVRGKVKVFLVICIFYDFELLPDSKSSKSKGPIKVSIIGALRKRWFAEEMGQMLLSFAPTVWLKW